MRTTVQARWLSADPGRAWAERFFLLYAPVWMTAMGLVMVLGIDERLGDVGFVVLGVALALPYLLGPALRSPENDGTPWHRTYWFKANLFLAVFGFFGNYFGSEYFFDVLGMVYHYPRIHWNLDAALVGSGEQSVPIIMYLLTHTYFMTYHSTAAVVLRRIRTSGHAAVAPAYPLIVFAIAYSWAWMETKAMANPLIADSFHYERMDRMLAYGSVFYALYFIVSFPFFTRIDGLGDGDGDGTGERAAWTAAQTVGAGLAASMLVFFLLDFATHVVGSI